MSHQVSSETASKNPVHVQRLLPLQARDEPSFSARSGGACCFLHGVYARCVGLTGHTSTSIHTQRFVVVCLATYTDASRQSAPDACPLFVVCKMPLQLCTSSSRACLIKGGTGTLLMSESRCVQPTRLTRTPNSTERGCCPPAAGRVGNPATVMWPTDCCERSSLCRCAKRTGPGWTMGASTASRCWEMVV